MNSDRGATPGVQQQAALFEDMLRRLAAVELVAGGTSGFTFIGDTTPTAIREGQTWYAPTAGVASVWSAGAWVAY